jgi:hypothetical protein
MTGAAAEIPDPDIDIRIESEGYLSHPLRIVNSRSAEHGTTFAAPGPPYNFVARTCAFFIHL